jgi:hypothetical protein
MRGRVLVSVEGEWEHVIWPLDGTCWMIVNCRAQHEVWSSNSTSQLIAVWGWPSHGFQTFHLCGIITNFGPVFRHTDWNWIYSIFSVIPICHFTSSIIVIAYVFLFTDAIITVAVITRNILILYYFACYTQRIFVYSLRCFNIIFLLILLTISSFNLYKTYLSRLLV